MKIILGYKGIQIGPYTIFFFQEHSLIVVLLVYFTEQLGLGSLYL